MASISGMDVDVYNSSAHRLYSGDDSICNLAAVWWVDQSQIAGTDLG